MHRDIARAVKQKWAKMQTTKTCHIQAKGEKEDFINL